MDSEKERKGEKESSGGNTSSKDKSSSSRTARSNWSVMAVKAKLTDKCLWSACKAMTAGFFFIVVGAGMATLGFYSDQLSTVEQTKGNTTIRVKNESKDSHLGSLTYLGPVVMGIGGFTIVAACVMTFEARDTAAKIVPIWFRRTRIHVVSGGSGSTPSGRSSKASWERFLSQQRPSEDAADSRSAVTQALVNFSKTLQNSIDANKIPQHNPYVSNQQAAGMRKCPSEPSLGKILRDANGNNLPESVALLEASTPQPSQRTTYGGGLKAIARPTKPQLLSVAPDTYRQTVSMDCPRMSRLNEDEKNDMTNEDTNDMTQKSERIKVQNLPFQTSCATSSSGSMSVDIYLPQGAVTLKIHDDMKESRKSSVKLGDSQESRGYKLSVQSDMRSFGDEDEFLSTELEDSVFINQDSSFSTPQIILNMLDSNPEERDQSSNGDYPLVPVTEKPTVEEWSNYPTEFIQAENKSDSLDVHSTEGSPQSLSLSTQFSFECSDKDSAEASIASVISNPFSSRLCDQRTFSQTDTSFINVSSLGSMGSSQDIVSPLAFSGSSQLFDYHQESFSMDPSSNENHSSSSNERANRMEKKNHSLPESNQGHRFANPNDGGHKTNPQKHSSLESAEIKLSKTKHQSSGSPRRQQFSFEGSEKAMHDPFLLPSPRYLSPGAASGLTSPTTHSPTVLTFSPRKTRSESLPERRQAPSLKRFPLLRQVALDAMAEEGGSTHRLDRSQTQISSKEAFFPDA